MIEVDRRTIIEALGQISEALSESVREPDRNWVVFFETVDLNGALSWTYRTGARNYTTAEEAVRQGLRYIPRFDELTQFRIREAFAIRSADVASFDSSRFGERQQFEMRW